MIIKAIILIITTIIILFFAACSSPAAQETTTQEAGEISPVATPVPTATPEPAPTPEPTLSEEEIERQAYLEEAEQLIYYWETYNDAYALFQVYDLIDEGKITDEILIGVDQEPWIQFIRTSQGYYDEKYFMMEFEKVMNGRAEDYFDEIMFDNAFRYTYYTLELGWVYISAFDTQESRDRVENGIMIINNYFENSTEENLIKFEKMYFDESNFPGEIRLFDIYFEYAPNAVTSVLREGKNYSISEYQKMELKEYGTSLRKWVCENELILIELNATPNDPSYVPKDWLTPEKIQELLSGVESLPWPSDKLPEYIPEITGVTITSVSEDGASIGFKGVTKQIEEEYIEVLISFGWEITSTFDEDVLHSFSAASDNEETIEFQWDEVSGNGGFGYSQ